MPFAKAHYYLILLFFLTLWAFWPTYLSGLPAGKPAWHVHAAGALLWSLLVIVQCWSIHSGRRKFHKSAGLASFAAFPLFLVGGLMAIHAEAATVASELEEPGVNLLAQFGFFDLLANTGFALLFYMGLKERRNMQLHSRYMIGTNMFLVAPIIWRLLREHVPIFNSDAGGSLSQFSYAFGIGNGIALAISLYLYRLSPNHGRPFLILAGFIAAQWALFETFGRLESWAWLFSRVSLLNEPMLIAATFAASVLIIWLSWVQGGRGPRASASTP